MNKVAIVDDHRLFRQGLAVILASKKSIEVVGKYETAIALLKALPNLEVDLILLDIDMPEMDGITAVPEIFKLSPNVKIVMLSMHLSGDKIQEAVAKNVHGYLLKTSSDDEVAKAIETVMLDKDYFSKEAHEQLVESFRNRDEEEAELTPREIEILKLVCEEMNSQEIAEKLYISVHTAETHRRNLLSKTGCRNSVGLVKYAMEKGYC